MIEPDEPCQTHVLPPHHRPDHGPGEAPPLFKFVVHWRELPLGLPGRQVFWAPGPDAALTAAQRELIGRFGPFGVTDVTLGAPKRVGKAKRTRWRLF